MVVWNAILSLNCVDNIIMEDFSIVRFSRCTSKPRLTDGLNDLSLTASNTDRSKAQVVVFYRFVRFSALGVFVLSHRTPKLSVYKFWKDQERRFEGRVKALWKSESWQCACRSYQTRMFFASKNVPEMRRPPFESKRDQRRKTLKGRTCARDGRDKRNFF